MRKPKPNSKTKRTASAKRKTRPQGRTASTKRYCLGLDLRDDPALIADYKRYHEEVWPEITQSLKAAGIEDMEIYLLGTRLFMIVEVNDTFSFANKAKLDLANPKVQEWENLMWNFQQPLPGAKLGEKWQVMERVFELEK